MENELLNSKQENDSLESTGGVNSEDGNEIRKDNPFLTQASYLDSYEETLQNSNKNLLRASTESTSSYDQNLTSLQNSENWRNSSSSLPYIERDWNEEFQKLNEQTDSPIKFQKLSQLAQDFVYAAKMYGKIICSEVCIPDEKKTIKPINLGGKAGGPKYIVGKILYKFALDSEGLHKGDENAFKIGGHELKGLMSYYSCQVKGLHFPLMALIDFQGFRLISVSLLPISDETLQYGSANGGITVKDSPIICEKMKQTALILNLQAHYAGLNEKKLLFSCGDCEGHIGNDQRIYLCDFARTFPPESYPNSNVAMHRLLRPELVIAFSKPLNPDAFLNWNISDPNRTIHEQDVREATQYLYNTVIPKLSKYLDSFNHFDRFQITEVFHRFGVNMRCLGYVRFHCNNAYIKCILFLEMATRCIASDCRNQMRQEVRSLQNPSIEPHRKIALDLLNQVILSDEYWKNTLLNLLEGKFYKIISTNENFGDLSSFVKRPTEPQNVYFLLKRICDLTGIKLSPNTLIEFQSEILELVASDIQSITTRIKFMNIIDFSSGMLCFHLASQKSGKLAEKLFSLSHNKFAAAVQNFPNSPHVLFHWGRMLFARTFGSVSNSTKWSLLLTASEKLKNALTLNNQLVIVQFQLHQILFHQISWQLKYSNLELPLFLDWKRTCLNVIHATTQRSYLFDILNKIDWFSEVMFKHYDINQAKLWLTQTTTFLNEIRNSLTDESFLRDILHLQGLVSFYLSQKLSGEEMQKMIERGAEHFQILLKRYPQTVIKKFTNENSLNLIFWYSFSLYSSLLKPKLQNYLQQLTILTLDYTYFTEQAVFEYLFQECPQLTHFSAKNCYHIQLPKCLHENLQELDLSSCINIGTFDFNSSQKFGLPNLKKVNFSKCFQIPESFLWLFTTGCLSLQTLDLNYLKKLNSLNLSHLYFLLNLSLQVCKGLTELFLPTSLTSLNINGCEALSDSSIKNWNAISLSKFKLDNCTNFSDKCLGKFLLSCSKLQTLSISKCSNISNLEKILSKLPELKELIVTKWTHSDNQSNSLSLQLFHKQLQILDVSDSKGNGFDLAQFSSLTSLILDGYALLPGGKLHSTSTMTSLNHLSFAGCHQYPRSIILGLISVAPSLENLDLSWCSTISDSCVDKIVKYCRNLKTLTLDCCYGITNVSLKEISEHCTLLEKANFSGCQNISDIGIFELTKKLTKLKELGLAMTKIADEGVVTICQTLGGFLTKLSLSACKEISSEGFLPLATRLYSLQSLELLGCAQVGPKALKPIVENLSLLTTLDLSDCHNCTDEVFLNHNLVYLQTLSLMNQMKITDKTCFNIARICTNLEYLNLRNCNQITEKHLSLVFQNCRKLSRINIKQCNISNISSYSIEYPHLIIEK